MLVPAAWFALSAIAAESQEAPTAEHEVLSGNASGLAAVPMAELATSSISVRLPICNQGSVPALTSVTLEILEPLGSRISKTGQLFRLRLAAPVNLAECEAIPNGLEGVGEVIQAKKHGIFSGAGGEFVAAARYLDFGQRRIRLRSLHLARRGGDRDTLVAATGTMVIVMTQTEQRPSEVTVLAGTIVEAKTAAVFDIAAPQDAEEDRGALMGGILP